MEMTDVFGTIICTDIIGTSYEMPADCYEGPERSIIGISYAREIFIDTSLCLYETYMKVVEYFNFSSQKCHAASIPGMLSSLHLYFVQTSPMFYHDIQIEIYERIVFSIEYFINDCLVLIPKFQCQMMIRFRYR